MGVTPTLFVWEVLLKGFKEEDHIDLIGRKWLNWREIWPYAVVVCHTEPGEKTYSWCMNEYGSSIFEETPSWLSFSGFVGDRLCEKYVFSNKVWAAKFILVWSEIVISSEVAELTVLR